MKTRKKTRERCDGAGHGAIKTLFIDLNGQLQSYLNALKTTAPEQRSN